MSILDGLVALGVLAGFGWVIFTKVMEKSPGRMESMKEWFRDKPKEKIKEPFDKIEQIYEEKRSIM